MDATTIPTTSSVFWLVPKRSMLHRTMPPGVSSTNSSATPRISDGTSSNSPASNSLTPSAAIAATDPASAACDGDIARVRGLAFSLTAVDMGVLTTPS